MGQKSFFFSANLDVQKVVNMENEACIRGEENTRNCTILAAARVRDKLSMFIENSSDELQVL
jgi:hypothetical protein